MGGYLTPIVIQKMGQVFSSARDIMKWLAECARVRVCEITSCTSLLRSGLHFSFLHPRVVHVQYPCCLQRFISIEYLEAVVDCPFPFS